MIVANDCIRFARDRGSKSDTLAVSEQGIAVFAVVPSALCPHLWPKEQLYILTVNGAICTGLRAWNGIRCAAWPVVVEVRHVVVNAAEGDACWDAVCDTLSMKYELMLQDNSIRAMSAASQLSDLHMTIATGHNH